MMPTLAPEPTMLQKFRFYLFLRRWKKSPLGQALAKHTQKYFYGNTNLKFYDNPTKEKMIADFHQRIFLLPSAPDPFLQFRHDLADCVIGYASLQVLCLKPEEKAESFYSHARYISADLYPHIRECVEHHDELKKIMWERPDLTDQDLIDGANMRSAVWLYYANGLNIVRSEFGETLIRDQDWFRPYVASAMVFEEETYRRKIGLPSLLPREDDLLALEHSTFMTWVMQGHRNPLYEWETAYNRQHADSI